MRFGEYLVSNCFITSENLEYALKTQALLNKSDSTLPIGEIAHELGMLTRKELEKALKDFKNC